MSITTELASVLNDSPGVYCGSCAHGLVFLPDGEGRFATHRCPCTHYDPVEYPNEDEAPVPDPEGDQA